MVVGFTTTCAISAYHDQRFEFISHSWQGVLDTTLCDKVCLRLAAGQWFSLVSSINKTDPCEITENDVKNHKPNHNPLFVCISLPSS